MSANYRKFPQFLTSIECAEIALWATECFERGHLKRIADGRHNNHLDSIPVKLNLLDEVANRIRAMIPPCVIEPRLKYFVTVNTTGASMDSHIDVAVAGMKHLRFNIWVTLPQGGRPVLHPDSGDEVVDLSMGDMWCLFASDFYHQTEAVKGDTLRISISFGFLLPSTFMLEDIK